MSPGYQTNTGFLLQISQVCAWECPFVCLQSQLPGICATLEPSNTKMNSVMFKSSFFSCPPLIAGAELPGWQSRGDSSSSALEFPISLCPIQTAEMCIQTSCLSTKASTDKRRRSDLAIWPGFKDSVLQAECLACRSCQRNGSCSHTHCLGWAPPLGTVRADEMFGLKLRWVLTHFGQQASVTCAQEIIETSQRKLRGFGWPWELLWWQVTHSRASLAWDIPGGSSHRLTVPLGVTGSSIPAVTKQQQGWLHRNHSVPVSPSCAEVWHFQLLQIGRELV